VFHSERSRFDINTKHTVRRRRPFLGVYLHRELVSHRSAARQKVFLLINGEIPSREKPVSRKNAFGGQRTTRRCYPHALNAIRRIFTTLCNAYINMNAARENYSSLDNVFNQRTTGNACSWATVTEINFSERSTRLHNKLYAG